MPDSDQPTIALIAESAAYRAAYKLLLDTLGGVISAHAEAHRASLAEAIEKRLHEKKGEYLFSAPLELSAALQAHANQNFQSTFSELSREIVGRVREG